MQIRRSRQFIGFLGPSYALSKILSKANRSVSIASSFVSWVTFNISSHNTMYVWLKDSVHREIAPQPFSPVSSRTRINGLGIVKELYKQTHEYGNRR